MPGVWALPQAPQPVPVVGITGVWLQGTVDAVASQGRLLIGCIVCPDGAPMSVLEAGFPARPCGTGPSLSLSLCGVRGHWLSPCPDDRTVSSLGTETGSW